jgi:pimeloyl-ACP methyl ester carboxylesterase
VASSTYVLIPGAWHGGWSWRPVAERLRAHGHRALTLTLPGLGDGDDPAGRKLQHAVSHVVDAVKELDVDDVVLVGHSWAGYPMTGAIFELGDKVAKAIYYNAHVPVQGRSMLQDDQPETAQLLRALIDASPTRSIPPTLDYVQQLFMQGVCLEAQRLLAKLLTPQPGAYFLDALDVPEVGTLALVTGYILSENDHALPRPGTEFAARLGVKPVMVPGTHESMLTHPHEVARAILDC